MHDPIARFTRNLLCYGQDIHAVADAAEAAPRDAQLNAFAAATALFGMTPASHGAADPYEAGVMPKSEVAAAKAFSWASRGAASAASATAWMSWP